jgi:glycosyltransferase involved in cell wall biosynthesis
MKKYLTIVIPCKNEEEYIYNTLESISKQVGSEGVEIIIADANSKDGTLVEIYKAKQDFNLNVKVICGGPVAKGRNEGAKLVTTEYVVFIDADAVLLDESILFNSLMTVMDSKNLKLLTCKLKSTSDDFKSKLFFNCFNFIQKYLLKNPFSTGVYFFTEKKEFDRLQGFDETVTQSEDYLLSRQYNKRDFYILNSYIGQDNRRFKKMGYYGFLKFLLTNYKNRNNINHFKEDANYWV